MKTVNLDINDGANITLSDIRTTVHLGAHTDAPSHYTAGGAKYMIFSDGAIEAETDDGAFRFASMAEFKSYIAGRKG